MSPSKELLTQKAAFWQLIEKDYSAWPDHFIYASSAPAITSWFKVKKKAVASGPKAGYLWIGNGRSTKVNEWLTHVPKTTAARVC